MKPRVGQRLFSSFRQRVKKQEWEKPLMSIENQLWIGLSFEENLVLTPLKKLLVLGVQVSA